MSWLLTDGRMMTMRDPDILYHLSKEYIGQRKWDPAFNCAKMMLKLVDGYNVSTAKYCQHLFLLHIDVCLK